ncbi:phosphatase PAP2 family protein [Haladaptatus sp. DJG-WS-42]|uniref:phosphatase PAP2 family protein n=1 Tax=Haladaptatus sp. DJG-WS-42 TaxID=3120516 RepID=UPI0030D017F0
MTRGLGELDVLRSLIPDLLVPVFALVTQLGDLWVYFVVLSVLYWLGPRTPRWRDGVDREKMAYVIALTLGALSLTLALKGLFALPRPPSPDIVPGSQFVPQAYHAAYEWLAVSDGYGFPSGHALGSTVVWGGLALTLAVSTLRRRLATATGIVALISLSRLVLGVHYLVDILAGVALGVTYLLIERRITGEDPRLAFWVAAGIAAVAFVTTGFGFEGAAALGATLGGVFTWQAVSPRLDRTPTRREAYTTAVLGLPVLGLLLALVTTVSDVLVASLLGNAVVIAGLLALPIVSNRK